MKKFTLSVSDELAERIDRYRDHLGNLSGLFQKAVDEKITKKEQFDVRLKEDPDIDEIAARLRQEQKEADNDFSEEGKDKGLYWAKRASYSDLKYAALRTFGGPYPHFHVPNSIFQDEVIGEYLQEVLLENRILFPVCPGDDNWEWDEDFDSSQEQWFYGWQTGVVEFWDHVSTKL